MATAVLNVEYTDLPLTFTNLDRYQRAFLHIRFKGISVGVHKLPVEGSSLTLRKKDVENFSEKIREKLRECRLYEFLQFDPFTAENFIRPKATVAVCTRNRTDDLERCIEALMLLYDDGQEYIVIDNCPSDDKTFQLVKRYPRIRYVKEEKAGLNNARNRALEEAQHEIVAFTDDDAVPEPNWLRALLKNFNQPLVMAVTGLTLPLELETEAQEAFEDYSPFNKGFNRRVFSAAHMNVFATGQVGAGANMAMRKSVVASIGNFDAALDAGTPTQSGGDHEIYARILAAGYKIVYEPKAISWHRHRRTWPELVKTIQGYGVGVYALMTRHLAQREWSTLRVASMWFLKQQGPNLLRSILKKRNAPPLQLVVAELKGCISGPFAYLIANRKKTRNELVARG